MSIVLEGLSSEHEMDKGQVLIVASGKGKKLHTDGIIVYDSYAICSAIPKILQEKGTLTDEVIYITGHGNKGKQTIAGLSMETIANLLIGNYSYTGKQKIIILSCYGKHKKKSEDMAESLCRHLSEKLHLEKLKELQRKFESVENNLPVLDKKVKKAVRSISVNKPRGVGLKKQLQQVHRDLKECKVLLHQNVKCEVEVVAEHTTIVVEKDTDKAYVYDLKVDSFGFGIFQKRQLRRMKCGHFKATEETMGDYYKKHRQELELYNSWLIVGKRVDEVMREDAIRLLWKMATILILGVGSGLYIIWTGNLKMGGVVCGVSVVIALLVLCYTALWEGR